MRNPSSSTFLAVTLLLSAGCDADFADDSDGTSPSCGAITIGISFELCAVGDITILDQSVAGNTVASNIPAAIISRAKNWALAASVDETENTDNDRILVASNYRQQFDDLVVWISPNILRTKMVNAGQLP